MSFTIVEGSFRKPPKVENTANTDAVIAFLEDALDKARNNKACVALVVIVTEAGEVIDGWSKVDGQMRPYVVVGALEAVKQRYMDTNIEKR